jgi:hypothetical protein
MKSSGRDYLLFALLCFVCVLVSGCGLIRRPPGIKAPGVSVTGPQDAGKPATLATAEAGTTMPIPAGSTVKVTQTDAQPATQGKPALPATTVTEIIPAAPTVITHTETKVQADTGTVDTSVARHRIDVEARRWLLWTAIGCGIAGVVVRSMLPAWGGLSNGLLMAGALAFGAWKFAEIPAWIWIVVLGVVGAMALGYKRAEWDRDGDGIPDFLQRKSPPSPPSVP